MKKFLLKVFLVPVILVVCFFLLAVFDIFVVRNQYNLNYQASIIDKVERLEGINESKIILVGHSNLTFGIDSEMIEKEIGMPVVNLGLHGGLGNAFHEEIAKLNINSGDIVIVCHSSYSDSDEIENTSLAWITIDNNREIWKIIRKKDYPEMFKAYPEYLRNSIFLWITHGGNKDEGGCYSRNAFNKYGDVVNKPKELQLDVEELFGGSGSGEVGVPTIGDECIERFNRYNRYIESRGAVMLIAGYPIAYGKYASFAKADFELFEKELRERLECDVISDFTDYFLPYECFYNTTLHLNEEGTELRTRQLIDDIRKWRGEK